MSKNQMPRHYNQQKTRYSKSTNKSIITISLTLCLVTGLALLSSPTIFSTNHLKQTTQTVKLILPPASCSKKTCFAVGTLLAAILPLPKRM
ncbi:MAG: hypothetical protein KGL95_02880 [Patescibacteria group bacterium]|nr:hypothetical protein [Patescibacteria group bacterium]